MKTLHEIMKDEYAEGQNALIDRKRGVVTPRALDGLRLRKPPRTEGLHLLTPEELLGVHVDETSLNGTLSGYQRTLKMADARRIAAWLRDGKPIPIVEIAVDGHGRCYFVDGQHRAAGAVIARVPIQARIQRLDKAGQAALFYSQRYQRRIDKNVLIAGAGDGLFEKYVQEALTVATHPWAGMVSLNKSSKTRFGPYAMYQLLTRYVGNANLHAATISGNFDDRWDRGLADELAPLIRCFGNKATNPLAFRPATLQSIGGTAMWVFRRRDPHPDDYGRWLSHMPLFPFEDWLHVRKQGHMVTHLIEHWNKGLRSGSRKVAR